MKALTAAAIALFFYSVIVIGWFSNLITLISGFRVMEDTEVALRIVGIVLAPLEALLGWFA